MSDRKLEEYDIVISDEDCYFTCVVCDQPARKVDRGRCIECYNKEREKTDRFLANDPIDW